MPKNLNLTNDDQLSAGNITESVVAMGRNSHAELHQHNHYYANLFPQNTRAIAPQLPPYYVSHKNLLSHFTETLIDPNFKGRCLAIYGAGGTGKSTLAMAIGNNKDIINAFPDGILWAQSGPEANILSTQVSMAIKLGGNVADLKEPFERTTVLKTFLQDKEILIIIDDIWSLEDLKHLNAGGPRCATLITTRLFKISNQADLAHKMASFQQEEAIDLLSKCSRSDYYNNFDLKAKLARQLEYLPLALRLAGIQAQPEYGRSWEELLEIFNNQNPDIQEIDSDDAKDRSESLQITFNISLDHLQNMPKTKDYPAFFAQLGVFASGRHSPFSIEAVSMIWEKNNSETQKILGRLIRDGLVEKENSNYHLHQLLGSYARDLLTTNFPSQISIFEKRHHDYYFQIALYSAKNWQIAETALPQMRLAYSRIDPTNWKLLCFWPGNTTTFLSRRGHWSDYSNWAETALHAAKEANDKNFVGWAENWLGFRDEALKRFDTALDHFYTALQTFQTIRHIAGIAAVTGNIGRLQATIGDIENAVMQYEKSIKLHRQIGEPQGLATNLNNLGLIKFEQGDHQTALNLYTECLEIRKKINTPGEEANTRLNIGDLYSKINNQEQAYRSFQKAHHQYILLDSGEKLSEPL